MSQDYEIQRSIGIGSFGQVFLARKVKGNKTFVIKKIKIRDITEVEKKNIENEVKLLQQLKHINIVAYKDSFIDKEGFLNIVMQNCEGGDMYQKIRNTNGKRFDENQIVDWFIQMALAIYYMHQRRILHRDLKTQNIFLTGGKIRLGDFGISKVLDDKKQLTETVIGTPYYMSPEQFKFKPYSYKTDIWSLGCMLYEMCNLRHAFDAQNINALSVKVLKGNYPPVNTQYSKSLRELVGKLLNINPKDRPTVIEILTMPFIRKRLMMYIQSCLKQEQNEDNHLDTLKEQAQKLGLEFVSSIPRHSEYMSTPSSVSKTQRIQQNNSSKLSHRNSKQILDKKALQSRKKVLEKELDEQLHQKIRIQEQLKNSQKKTLLQKRHDILERQKERRRKILSSDKQRSISTPSLVLARNQKSRDSSSSIVNVSTEAPEDITSFSSVPPKPQVSHVQEKTQKVQQSQGQKQPLKPAKSVPKVQFAHGVQRQSKIFRMQEQYDMDFEEEGGNIEDQPDTIYEMLDDSGEDDYPAKSINIPEEINDSIASPVDLAAAMVMVNAIKDQLKMKTAKINSLRTELLQIDFEVSADSINDQLEAPVNPKYLRVQERISSLKTRLDSLLGRKKFESLSRLLQSQRQGVSTSMRDSVAGIIGGSNLGCWHLMNQMMQLQETLPLIPEYV